MQRSRLADLIKSKGVSLYSNWKAPNIRATVSVSKQGDRTVLDALYPRWTLQMLMFAWGYTAVRMGAPHLQRHTTRITNLTKVHSGFMKIIPRKKPLSSSFAACTLCNWCSGKNKSIFRCLILGYFVSDWKGCRNDATFFCGGEI
jgi:hypothetical protein